MLWEPFPPPESPSRGGQLRFFAYGVEVYKKNRETELNEGEMEELFPNSLRFSPSYVRDLICHGDMEERRTIEWI